MGVAISSEKELEAWLKDKPRAWAQVIAVRTALRVLPITCDPAAFRDRTVDPRLPLAVFRLLAVSLAATKHRADEMVAATLEARTNARTIGYKMGSNDPQRDPIFAATYAAFAFQTRADTARAAAAAAAASAAAAARAARAAAAVWQAIAADCERLEEGLSLASVLNASLWPKGLPEWLGPTWNRTNEWLDGSKDGFGLWREWYQRKLAGQQFEFAGFDEATERAFFKQLFTFDDEWWRQEPAAVNAEMKGLVDGLRKPRNEVDFFISYADEDEVSAREVGAILDELGHSYLVQYRDFPQGNWINQMNGAMARSERLIALYTADYVASDHCNTEWNHFYRIDPSSAERRIVAFRLDRADLKPMMEQIVYRDLTPFRGPERRQQIRDWIAWKPVPPTRAAVEQAVTEVLSPRIVANEAGKLDTEPDPVFDQPELPGDLRRALAELAIMLDLVKGAANNLPSMMMQGAVSRYDAEFTANQDKSSWGALDRLVSILTDGIAQIPEGEFSVGHKRALEEFIAAHKECMATLRNADAQRRRLADVSLENADQNTIDTLVDKLKALFDQLRTEGLTTPRLDGDVDHLVTQGRDFAHQAGMPDADQRPPHAMQRYIKYVGGFGITTLGVLGSLASMEASPTAAQIISDAQQLVEAFFRIVGI